jgi:hypothetical protein
LTSCQTILSLESTDGRTGKISDGEGAKGVYDAVRAHGTSQKWERYFGVEGLREMEKRIGFMDLTPHFLLLRCFAGITAEIVRCLAAWWSSSRWDWSCEDSSSRKYPRFPFFGEWSSGSTLLI